MKKVAWESGGVEYEAVKLTQSEMYRNLRSEISALLMDNRKPTKIISSSTVISYLKYQHVSIFRGDSLYYDCRLGMLGVPLQADRRVKNDVAYILYEKIKPDQDEAPEFAGLDELP